MMLSLMATLILAPQQGPLIGTYRTDVRDAKGRLLQQDAAPGAVRVMTFRKNHTWIWRDMMVGFEGTWRMQKGRVELTTLTGPSGKLAKPQKMLLKVMNKGKTLELSGRPELNGMRVRFLWEPKIMERLKNSGRARSKDGGL